MEEWKNENISRINENMKVWKKTRMEEWKDENIPRINENMKVW